MNATDPSRLYSAAQAVRSGGREPVRQALLAARQRTLACADAYAASLARSNMRVPCVEGLNPPLWEQGHIAWFQEYWIARNQQRALGVRCDPDHVRAASVMAQADSWYDSSRVAHATRWDLPVPDGAGTRAYLAETLRLTMALLDQLPADAGDDDLYFFRLGALHEDMHAEASAYMARALGIALPPPAADDGPASGAPGSLTIPAQRFRVGYAGPGFAFDNELDAHDVWLDAFEIDAVPVTGRRFHAFVDDDGYRQRDWWTREGWQWLQQATVSPPLEGDAPAVHVNAHEAQAWCRWAGRRLPTEAQWECAAITHPGFAWGRVWEWTATTFEPFAGFVPHPYRDYSVPWFSSRRVLKGACAATSPSIRHPRYRNFFEPHRRDIFAGFRSCACP